MPGLWLGTTTSSQLPHGLLTGPLAGWSTVEGMGQIIFTRLVLRWRGAGTLVLLALSALLLAAARGGV